MVVTAAARRAAAPEAVPLPGDDGDDECEEVAGAGGGFGAAPSEDVFGDAMSWLCAGDRAASTAVCRGWRRVAAARTAADAAVLSAAAAASVLCSPHRLPPTLCAPPALEPLPGGVPVQYLLVGAAHVALCELLLRDRLSRVTALVHSEWRRVMGRGAPALAVQAGQAPCGRDDIAQLCSFDPPSQVTLRLPLLDSVLSVPLQLPAAAIRGLAAPLIADAARRMRDGEALAATPLSRVAELMARS